MITEWGRANQGKFKSHIVGDLKSGQSRTNGLREPLQGVKEQQIPNQILKKSFLFLHILAHRQVVCHQLGIKPHEQKVNYSSVYILVVESLA